MVGPYRSSADNFGVFFPGETAPRLLPNPAYRQTGYDTLGASASFASGPTSVRLYGTNLDDARPRLDHTYVLGNYVYKTLRPRTIGFEARYDF